MKTYTPNFNDPRVITRSQKALGFAVGVMSETKPHAWSTRYIDKYFGQSQNEFSQYLRDTLLIVTDDFYRFNSDKNKCKEYKLNASGVIHLIESLNIDNHHPYPSVLQVIKDDHSVELNSGNFKYSDKSNRLWHPLQRYRKQFKKQVLDDHGYQYHYDIECCAPTLIHQYSQMVPEIIINGKWMQGPMDQYLNALTKYLSDRTQVRNDLANQIDLPAEAIKEIINAMFAGAVISKNTESDIYSILNGDISRIEFLKQDAFISELHDDIKVCWSHIRPLMQKRTTTTIKGTERLLPITCKQRWNVYFEQERVVLDSVRSYLDDHGFKYFLEHDGWSCNSALDKDELTEYIRSKTGYVLKFDYTYS